MTHSCILCGAGILSISPSNSCEWMREYRAVYRNGHDILVTGVGYSDGGISWKLPEDPSLRWNTRSESDLMLEVPVMRQPATGGTHGFVIHNACWEILQKASEPAGFSLERLICVCESLPFPIWYNGVSWGHDYMGYQKLDDGQYPWVERFSFPSLGTAHDMGVFIDPFDESHFRNTLALAKPCRPKASFPSVDCDTHFSRLPQELLNMIIVSLPTNDALKLRLVSRSFLPLFNNLTFWLSRFEPDRERGFLFELRESKTAMDVDQIISLYIASRRCIAGPGLLNRGRVWKLARRLFLLTELTLVKPVPHQSMLELESKCWFSLVAKEQSPVALEEWRHFDEGCRSTMIIDIQVSTTPVRIGIVKVNTGLWDYITGIRIIDQDGHVQSAGYMSDRNETICDITAFHGFRVAMGPGGVRALQIVGDQKQSSRWIGRTEGMPISERLIMEAPVQSLRVTLDNYKITALAVSHPSQTCAAAPSRIGYQHSALWYPSIPPAGLTFNEASYAGNNPLSGYQPLSWIHFGGTAGTNISQVRGICVQSSHNIYSLQVVCDETCGGQYTAKLGWCKEQSLSSGPIFPIDGAGGERIDSVSVGMRHFEESEASTRFQPHVVQYIMITTNRGRTTCMGKQADDLEIRSIDIAQGTTITGFYGHKDMTCGMTSLGVISEPMDHS